MSRRCLICANINPCRLHSTDAQDAELRRNKAEIRRLSSVEITPPTEPASNPDGFEEGREADVAEITRLMRKHGIESIGKIDDVDTHLAALSRSADVREEAAQITERRIDPILAAKLIGAPKAHESPEVYFSRAKAAAIRSLSEGGEK